MLHGRVCVTNISKLCVLPMPYRFQDCVVLLDLSSLSGPEVIKLFFPFSTGCRELFLFAFFHIFLILFWKVTVLDKMRLYKTQANVFLSCPRVCCYQKHVLLLGDSVGRYPGLGGPGYIHVQRL